MNFNTLKKKSPVVGYVILACATAFTFQQQHQNVVDTRNDLARTTYNVLYEGCINGNALRHTLQEIITSPKSIANLKKLVASGRISQAEFERAVALAKQEAASIAPRDCKKAYAALKPK